MHCYQHEWKLIFRSVHQDIKPSNILVAPNSLQSPFDLTFKLVDLALVYFNTSTGHGKGRKRRDGRGTQTFSKCSDTKIS